MDTLTTIEQKDERDRATYKEAQDEVKSAQAKLRETSEPTASTPTIATSRRATIPTVEELNVTACRCLSYQRKKVPFGSLLTTDELIKELFASHIQYQGLAKHCSKWKDSNMQLHLI